MFTMHNTMVQKSFSWMLVVAVVLWAMSGVFMSLTLNAQAATAGDLIKMSGLSSVYYYASDGKRYVFPNEKTYMTWYADFSTVKTISQTELESIPIGGNVKYRAGTRLGKITTSPYVYAITPGGMLHHVPDEATAKKLYGDNWNKMVDDIPDAFFTNYTVSTPLTASSKHPEGTLIQYNGSPNIYYIDESGMKRLFADFTAFTSNGFQTKYVLTGFDQTVTYGDGSSITGMESEIKDTAQLADGGSTVAAGSVTIAIASDTPAATTITKNAARVPFLKFNVTAGSDGDATIDSIAVERTNLCANANFQDLLLLDGSMNQLGNEKSLGSNNMASFNDDLVIPSGTTKSYYLAANMASSINNGDVCQLNVKTVTMKGSTSVNGTLPLMSAPMTTNGNISIGTVTVRPGGSQPSASTQKVGVNDYIVSAVKLTADSTEEVELHKLAFYQNGSAGTSDLEDFKLWSDGAVIKTVTSMSNKDLIFDFSDNPIKIGKGNNKEFNLSVDIKDGSSRTISLDVEKKAAVAVKGKTYGYFITPTYVDSSSNTVSASPYFNANDTTIGAGAVSVSKGVLTSLNVAEGANQQALGAFKFNVEGEPAVVSRIAFHFTVSGTGNAQDITDVTLYDPNGNVVAGPVDPGTTSNSATSTDTFTIPVGIHTYTLKGDLNSDFAANDTIIADVTPGVNFTVKGEATNLSITPTPSTAVSGDTTTVKVAALAVSASSNPAAQTVIIGQSGFAFANFQFNANDSGEDIRITQLLVHQEIDDAAEQTNVANLQFYDGTTPIAPVMSPTSVTAATSATTTFSFSSPIIVAKGTTKTLTLKGDIIAGGANDTVQFSCFSGCPIATGASTANSVTPTVTSGRGAVMTLQTSGTVTVADDASDPSNTVVAGGTSDVVVGQLRLTANNEDVDLTRLTFSITGVNSGGSDEIDMLSLWNGNTKIAEIAPTSTSGTVFRLDAGEFRIAKGSTGAKLTLKATFANIGTGYPGDSGQGVDFNVADDDYEFRGVSSGSAVASGSQSGTFDGSEFTVYKSFPVVTQQSVGSTLNNGTDVVLYKFTVGADSHGDIGFYEATFGVTTNSATVTNFKLYEDPSGVRQDLTSRGALGVSETITTGTGSGTHNVEINFYTDTSDTVAGTEYRQIAAGASKTYQLEGTVSSAVAGSSVSVKLLSDNAFPTTYPDSGSAIDSVANGQDNFIWSDLYMGNNSTTATGANEWTNGYRIFATTTGSTLTK